MKTKFLFLFVVAFCIGSSATAQTIYFFQYRFNDDTTLYRAFLVRNEDGSGFYRVRFHDPESHSDILADMDMEETYYQDKDGYFDTTKLYFKGSNPKIIAGPKDFKYYPDHFWFKLDPGSGLFEPWAVTSPMDAVTSHGVFVEPPNLIEQQELTEDFVSYFFLKDEDFYKSLFTTTQRQLTPSQKQAQLHLVIVANTEDESIGPTCALDKDRTLKTFKDLAEFLGIGFDSKVIFGDSYNKQNVQSAIDALNPNPKDMVIFYYSGHGFNDPKGNRTFPNMALSNKSFEDAVASSMNIEDVYNIIKTKGARFNLVISDCCNNRPDDKESISCDIPRTRSSTLGWSLENCKSLFMNDKPMSILATAAQKGEQSTGNMAYGGFFTSQFRSNLVTYFGPFHQFPTWDAVLAEAQKTTTEQAENSRCSESNQPVKVYKQHPIYRIQ